MATLLPVRTTCDICNKNFNLVTPDNIIECRVVDKDGEDMREPECAFACNVCMKSRYIIRLTEEEE